MLASGAGITSDNVIDPNVTYAITGGATGQAVTVTPQASYGAPVAGSRWINTSGSTGCDQACGSPGSPLATAYTMKFDLPAGFTAPSISIQVLADDAASVFVNGNPFGQQVQNKGSKNYANLGTFATSNSSFFKLGTNTLTVSNIDYGGSNGVDFSATVTYTADTTPPVASPTAAPMPNAAGWNNTDVVVSWNWADGSGAGIDSTKCTTLSTTSGEFSTGQTLTASCTDLAGNPATATYTVQKVDKSAPTISGSASPAPNGAGWNNTDVTVTFTCDDSLSGIASCTAPKTLSGDGEGQTATGTVMDVAGNAASTTVSGINIDTKAPQTTVTAPGGWNNSDVTLKLTATDALSGVAGTSYVLDGGSQQSGTTITISSEGTHTLAFWSVDAAGNTEAQNTVQVKIDKTAPTISDSTSPAANVLGWNNSDVTVTFTCDDTLSGIASCTAPTTVSTEGEKQPVTGTATDNAGNTATDPVSVSIDTTKPTISAAADREPNAAGWYNAPVTVSFACDDALSGVAACPAAQILNEGPDQTASGTATDAADNTASASVTSINIDETAPTITAAATTDPNTLGFYSGPVTVHFTCDDALSGVVACPPDQELDIAGTSGSVSSTAVTVTDTAGNVSQPANIVSVTIDKTPSATPLLVKAASGSNGGIAGLVQTDGSTSTYDVTLYLSPSCSGNVPGATQELGTATVTLDKTGAGTFAINLAGLPAGDYITATGTDGLHLQSGFATCVQVGASNDSWPTALDITSTGGNAGAAAPGFTVDAPGQSRWFKFSITPGEQLTIDLSGLPADYDLAVFKDIPQAYESLTSVADLNKLGANFAGQAFSAQAFSPQAFSAQAFSPQAFSAQAFSPQAFSADVYSGQAFSAQAFSGQAFSAQAFSAQAFSGQAFSAQAFSGQAFSAQAFSPQAFSSSEAYSGQAFSAQAFSPQAFSPQAFSGQAFSPQAFSSAQVQSLIAVSAAPGTSPETVTANTWNNTGDFYVRVSGKNGAFVPAQPFTLQATNTGVSCKSVKDMGSAPSTAVAGGYKTVILTDSSRIAGSATDIDTLNQRLATFAARPEVKGVVVDVATDTRIHGTDLKSGLVGQADANKGCPYAENLVASALKQIVDSYRPSNPLAYVVLVGGDSVIPFFRHPDEAGLAPESNYIPPVIDTTASQASLQLNYVLSQDAYGAGTSVDQNANTFPVPGLAVGRLVETAADATTMLDAYLSTSGGVVATPTKSLVTGYDFLTDGATSVKKSLDAGIGTEGDSLLAPNNISPTDPLAWTATDLKAKLLGSRHDIVFLAGHFAANSALAADFDTTVSTADLAASSTDFTNSIVFSAGCHSGYNIVNADAVPGITWPLDWSEAFAQKGATLIAGTGYQYGDTDFEMYSEQIYAAFAEQLRMGTGPVSIGQALVRAKLAYLASTPTLRGIDTKALLESTLFGLPMLSVDMPSGRGGSNSDASVVGGLTTVPSGPGKDLGLKTADLLVNDPLAEQTQQFKNPDGTNGPTATWYSGSAGVTNKPFEPTLPLVNKNVSVPGTSLRGVGFWGGSYTDTTGITPLTGAATEDLRGVHTPFQSPVFYPMRLSTPNYFGSVADSSGVTRLLVTPAQHKADLSSASTSTLRLFNSLQLKLFYNASTETRTVGGVVVTPALAAAPSILDVTATPSADGSAFTVDTHVIGDPSAGIQEVWITYTANNGTWESLDLARDANNSTHWSTTIATPAGRSLSDVRFMVQAANGVGLVSVADNYGAYYAPVPATAANANKTTVTLAATPANLAYGQTATFKATLSGAVNNANQPITFTVGSMAKTSLTNGNGVAEASFQLTSLPATYPLSATFPGDATDQASTASRTFTVDKVSTTLALSGSTEAAPGTDSGVIATLKDGNGLPVTLRTVWFVVSGSNGGWTTTVTTNYLGEASLGVIPLPAGDYTLSAYFDGTFTLEPSSTTVKLNDGTYLSSSASVPFSLTKTTATLAFDPASLTAQTYTGNPITVTVTTSPAGLDTTVTYDGSSSPPINAGSYAVVATVNDPTYQGSASGTLVVNKADQTITFTQPVSPATYNTTFTVSPTATSTLPVAVTASGGCTVSGTASPYTVKMTSGTTDCVLTASHAGNTNYNAATSVTRTVNAAKATATLTFDSASLSQTYDGNPKSVTVTTTPSGLQTVNVTYNGMTALPTDAGSYAVVATLDNANYQGSASGTLKILQATPSLSLSVYAQIPNQAVQFSDTVDLVATLPAGATGEVTFTFKNASAGPVPVVNGTARASIRLDSNAIPGGSGSYNAVASFVAYADSNYGSTSKSAAVTVLPEGQLSSSSLDRSARLDYTGDQFAIAGTAPTLSVALLQGLGTAGDRQPVDFSQVGNVQVSFKLYPATCATSKKGVTSCSPALTTILGPATVKPDGTASVVAPANLAYGAYVVVASVTSGNAFINPEPATSALEVSPTGITSISGGGYVSPDPTSNAATQNGYFAFDTEKLNKGTVTGSMAYIYRVRASSISTTTFVPCDSFDSSCHDVDVIVRSISVNNLNGGQKGYATGTIAVSFVTVDTTAAIDYTKADYATGSFRIDIVDNSQQGMPSQFGFTAYLADGTTPFHQAYVPADGGIAQTGIGVMTNETTIANGFITSHP